MRVEKPAKSIHFPDVEKLVQAFWDANRTFQRSIEERPADRAYNFYDGPPFATGLPHFGHFVPSSIKDAFPRYFTMKGHRVERRFGWDCHGLPVEMLVQQELGLNGRAEIEAYGIAKFNEACRESVLRYTGEWREYMRRLGRWVDMDDEYRTMDAPFMESVWNVFKRLWDAGLIYEGKFVVSYSAALGATLANFEASLDFREVQDPSVTLRAKLGGAFAGRSLLIWTTTPWTLPANVAIAVDPAGDYVELKDAKTGELAIVLASLRQAYWPGDADAEVLRTFKGAELHGVPYEPFFDGFVEQNKGFANAYKVLGTDYVLHDTGTGAVHTAPCFGEDDFNCAKKYGLPLVDHLDVNGKFLPGVNPPEVAGQWFKDGDKPLMQILKARGLVFKHDTIVHPYPYCYRSRTPLMYRAMPSWFVNVEKLKPQLLANNELIHWVPDHVKAGRFGKWLENARDWNIGRARYWGNPLPIWKNDETGEAVCLGSMAELEKHAGRKISDLHIHNIDDITLPSPTGRGTLKRVPFVLDCWFESGAMPYAQLHYPFEHAESFAARFPADFICEGLDQTRGWFYTLHVLATALFGKPAFKNVVMNGLVLAADGKKMSKSLRNFPDPMGALDEFGADSIRLFLLNSPATVGDEVRFNTEGVRENTRKVLLPLWNAYSFFTTYASVEAFDPERHPLPALDKLGELDRWVLLRLNELMAEVDGNMRSYKIAKATPAITQFFDDLNNWYIRRNRRRFWEGDKDAFAVLFHVLVRSCQLLAPFAPFISEHLFGKLALTQALRSCESVHLSLLPDAEPLSAEGAALLERVALARRVVELGRMIRVQHKLKVRQPLKSVTIGVLPKHLEGSMRAAAEVIRDELNVKEVKVTTDPWNLAQIRVKPDFKAIGKGELKVYMKEIQAAAAALPQEVALKVMRGEAVELGGSEAFPRTLVPASMLSVEMSATGSQLVATDPEFIVALDPELTPELKMEGTARELVSLVQKARKTAAFEVEERIELGIETSPALRAAIEANRSYIEEETLAHIMLGALPAVERRFEEVCDGEAVVLELSRKGRA